MKKVLMISSHFPPVKSGLSDYTEKVYNILNINNDVMLFVPSLESTSWNSLDIYKIFFKIRRENFDSILIQYVPYMYGRRGLCPLLMLLLIWIKLFSKQNMIINIHEIHYPNLGTIKTWLLSTLHNYQAKILGLTSTTLITTTARFKRELEELTSKHVYQIPVGSNISKSSGSYSGDVKNGFILFGSFHESKMYDEIYSNLLNKDISFIRIGIEKTDVPDHLQKYITKNISFTGKLNEDDVGIILNSKLPILAPFIDGTSVRRGTMIAGLCNGNHVISTYTNYTDEILLNLNGLTLYSVDNFITEVEENIEELSSIMDYTLEINDFKWSNIVNKIEKYL